MARDTHVLKDFEARLRDAGGAFVRVTGKGYRRWHLKNGKQVTIVDLPTKGYEFGHQKKNVEAEIKRALKACGRVVREEPKRKAVGVPAIDFPGYKEKADERAIARATPSHVAEEAPPQSPVPDGEGATRDTDRDDRPEPAVGGVDFLHRDEPPPEEQRASDPDGDLEPSPDVPATAGTRALRCEVCGETFLRPLNLGRHRQARHGLAGARAKPAKVDDVPVGKVTISASPAASQSGPGWRFAEAPARPVLTGPPPLGMSRPTATLVAGTATMEKVASLAEALATAARDLVTEYRLVREENTRLTETVQQMERMFEGLRRR